MMMMMLLLMMRWHHHHCRHRRRRRLLLGMVMFYVYRCVDSQVRGNVHNLFNQHPARPQFIHKYYRPAQLSQQDTHCINSASIVKQKNKQLPKHAIYRNDVELSKQYSCVSTDAH
jgi:hypothetical protein